MPRTPDARAGARIENMSDSLRSPGELDELNQIPAGIVEDGDDGAGEWV